MKTTKLILGAGLTLILTGGVVSAVAAEPSVSAHTPTTYFVSGSGNDTNAGQSPRQPFLTIQHAADLTEPGDVVRIMDGVYGDTSGEGVVSITRSGTLDAPITYTTYRNDTPVLRPVTGWNGILVAGASHIVIDGLEIQGNSDNLTLADAAANANPAVATYNQNCINAREDESGKPWSHLTVVNSNLYDCPGGGVATAGGDYITIENNVVHSNAWYSVYANSGISVLAPEDIDGNTGTKITIRNNVAYDNESKVKWIACDCISDGNGIILDSTLNARNGGIDYAGRTLVANNVAFDNGGTGIHSYRSANVDIYNNTAYLNSRSGAINNPNIGAWDSRDVRLINNVSVARPGKITNLAYLNENVLYDYNTYWGGTAPEVMGPNDQISDPELVNPSTDPDVADFRLRRSSPAVDTGLTLTEVTVDANGKKRPAGRAYDRGAYELPGRH